MTGFPSSEFGKGEGWEGSARCMHLSCHPKWWKHFMSLGNVYHFGTEWKHLPCPTLSYNCLVRSTTNCKRKWNSQEILLLQGRPKWHSQPSECNTKHLHVFYRFSPTHDLVWFCKHHAAEQLPGCQNAATARLQCARCWQRHFVVQMKQYHQSCQPLLENCWALAALLRNSSSSNAPVTVREAALLCKTWAPPALLGTTGDTVPARDLANSHVHDAVSPLALY